MDRINGANTVDIGGGKRGWRKQDKTAGIAGTEMTASWHNAVQEEILAVIEGAGIEPDEETWTQLRQAIAWMIANATPEADLSALMPKAGGTFTGPVYLDAAPVDDMEPVNKGYLDALLGGDTSSALYIVRLFGGSANGLAGSPRPTAPVDLTTGDLIIGQLAASNTTTAVTCQLGTGTIYSVTLNDGATLPPVGKLVGGHLVLFRYDGTNIRAMFDFTSGLPLAPAAASSSRKGILAAWGRRAATSGALSGAASINISSVTMGAGTITVTFATPLDTADYEVMPVDVVAHASTDGAVYGISGVFFTSISSKTVTGFSCVLGNVSSNGGGPADGARIPGFLVIG